MARQTIAHKNWKLMTEQHETHQLNLGWIMLIRKDRQILLHMWYPSFRSCSYTPGCKSNSIGHIHYYIWLSYIVCNLMSVFFHIDLFLLNQSFNNGMQFQLGRNISYSIQNVLAFQWNVYDVRVWRNFVRNMLKNVDVCCNKNCFL